MYSWCSQQEEMQPFKAAKINDLLLMQTRFRAGEYGYYANQDSVVFAGTYNLDIGAYESRNTQSPSRTCGATWSILS
jgi:hypothetical protein